MAHHNLYGLPIDVHPGYLGEGHLKRRDFLGRGALKFEKDPFFSVIVGPAHQVYRIFQNRHHLFLAAPLEIVVTDAKGFDRWSRLAIGTMLPWIHGDHAVGHERRTAATLVKCYGCDI